MLCCAKSLQSCLTLCDPIDGSPPGSPIPGILQARTLEWVAIAFSIISWLQSPSAVILEPKRIKSLTVSIASSSLGFLMMYSAYKLKKQGDNI